MSLAAIFFESHSLQQIIGSWSIFEKLYLNKRYAEQVISTALDVLMHEYGISASLVSNPSSKSLWPPVNHPVPICL